MAKFILDSVADGLVTLRVPGKNYRNTYQVAAESVIPAPGNPVCGTIVAAAWKVDRVSLGGNYVEPLYGRPRRMQGTVVEVFADGNALLVDVSYPVTVKLPERYRAADFAVGTRIAWDNVDIPTFQVESRPSQDK